MLSRLEIKEIVEDLESQLFRILSVAKETKKMRKTVRAAKHSKMKKEMKNSRMRSQVLGSSNQLEDENDRGNFNI